MKTHPAFPLAAPRRAAALFVAPLLMLLLMLTGCSGSDNSDLEHLLSTVPADVSGAIGVDVAALLKESGSKTGKDGTVTLAPALEEALAQSKGFAPVAARLADGKSGLTDAPLVLFAEGEDVYLTGLLADTDAFTALVEELEGEKFTADGDVRLCGYFAVKGTQFWYSRSALSAKDVNRFTGLDDRRSLVGSPLAALLTDASGAVSGFWDTQDLARLLLGPKQGALAAMGVAALYKDPSFASLSLDFKKGRADADIRILTADAKPARFLLPADRVDTKTVMRLGDTADVVIAFNVGPKLVALAKERGAGLLSLTGLDGILSSLDGTIAYAAAAGWKQEETVITTDGKNSTALSSMLAARGASVTTEGDLVIGRVGTVAGTLAVKDAASKLGAGIGGMVCNGSLTAAPGSRDGRFRMASCVFVPENNSITVRLSISFLDADKSGFVQAFELFR